MRLARMRRRGRKQAHDGTCVDGSDDLLSKSEDEASIVAVDPKERVAEVGTHDMDQKDEGSAAEEGVLEQNEGSTDDKEEKRLRKVISEAGNAVTLDSSDLLVIVNGEERDREEDRPFDYTFTPERMHDSYRKVGWMPFTRGCLKNKRFYMSWVRMSGMNLWRRLQRNTGRRRTRWCKQGSILSLIWRFQLLRSVVARRRRTCR